MRISSFERWLVSFYTVLLYLFEVWKVKPPYAYILYAYGGFFVAPKKETKMATDYINRPNMENYIPDIQSECLCSPSMASAARSETVMLINKTDLSKCLRERQVI